MQCSLGPGLTVEKNEFFYWPGWMLIVKLVEAFQ